MLKKKMKKPIYLIACILISIFLIQFSSAVLTWSDWGGENTQLTQAQFSSISSRFDEDIIITDTLGQGQSYASTRIPSQPLVATLVQDENSLILQNGNYLQIYDENLDLLAESLTGTSEGTLGSCNFDSGTISNDIAGYYKFNNTILSFRVFNISEDYTINKIIDVNMSLGNFPIQTNGVRCTTNECYAFISEQVNATTYLQYFQIATYNETSESVDFTTYSLFYDDYPALEPPAYNDWDSDTTTEFLGFSKLSAFVVDYSGSIEFNYAFSGDMVGAKFIQSDAGNQKIILVADFSVACGGGSYNCIWYRVVKSDTSTLWEEKIQSFNSGDTWKTGGIAIEDYNGDGYDDIFTTQFKTGSNTQTDMKIYKGSDGSELYTYTLPSPYATASAYPTASLTIGRLTRDSTFDFIQNRNNAVFFFDTANSTILKTESISGYTGCVPADLTYDNLLDVVCTSPSSTKSYIVNYTNQNAYITSVTYDPSLIVEVDSTLYTYISATDPEGDSPLYYSIKCNASADWTSDTTSNTQSCYFTEVGQANVSVRVRDPFHLTYDEFSQIVTITQTGEVCDNDGICEAEQGETYINCPNDCEAPAGDNYTQVEGGIAIPVKIVDTENYNQGLLPEIYYGTLGFFSRVTLPFIIFIFLIFSVLIILVIAGIIKKIAMKVANT